MNRKTLSVALALVGLLIVACGPGTPTPMPDCTPPACASGEVYHCPDDCPGGCGTICVTPSPAPAEPTVETEQPASTGAAEDTPRPVCTPPACAADEVYHCPGECPGGCGTVCATPSPAPSEPTAVSSVAPPEIVYFSVEPDSIIQGEPVTFSWEAHGGTEAWIQWTDSAGILQGIAVDPSGGTETLMPSGTPVGLYVRNSAGEDTETINLIIACAYEWVPALAANPPSTHCPFEAQYGPAAQQSFQNGFMIWFETGRVIYVFYSDVLSGGVRLYQAISDEFVEGDPESDPAIIAPDGLYQPIRGFGLAWRTDPEVRQRLGWATAPEAGFDTWFQGYSATGMHSSFGMIQGIDGTIYTIEAMGSSWVIYQP